MPIVSHTAQKIKFSIRDFFSKFDQICRTFLLIKSLSKAHAVYSTKNKQVVTFKDIQLFQIPYKKSLNSLEPTWFYARLNGVFL